MDDKYIILIEKYFDDLLSEEEKKLFLAQAEQNPDLKREFEEQKKIKELLRKMNLKNPTKEFWDAYWLKFLNRIERSVAWTAIILGAVIVLGYGFYHIVDQFLSDTQTPGFLKFGIAVLFLGAAVLLISVIREKLTVRSNDKYKEIQR